MTSSEMCRALARGESLSECDLRASDPFIFDLSGRDLSDWDLSSRHVPSAVSGRASPRSWHDHKQIVLRRVRLSVADRRDADLRGADFVGAVLTCARLEGATWDGPTDRPEGFEAPR